MQKKLSTKFSTHLCKKSPESGTEGTYLNIIKVIYEKLIASIIFNGGKLRAFPPDQEQQEDVHYCHTHSTQFWKSNPQQSKRKKK